MNFTDIEELRATHKKGWDQSLVPNLFISYNPEKSHYIVKDWSGYLCTTESETILKSLLLLEAAEKGNVRKLITGQSIEKLRTTYQLKREELLCSSSPASSPSSKNTSSSERLLRDLDITFD